MTHSWHGPLKTLWAGALMALGTLACGQPLDSSSSTGEVPPHKVQATPEQTASLRQRGARALADYGTFSLWGVDDATLAGLAGVELHDEYNLVLLNAGAIDTASAAGKQLRRMTLPAAGKAFHLVQFVGPIQPAWVDALQDTGVQVVTYIPHNAYLVHGDAAALQKLDGMVSSSPVVQWHGDYLDAYKLDPALASSEAPKVSVQLLEDPEANAATLELLEGAQSKDMVVHRALGYVNIVVTLDAAELAALSARPDVVSVQPRPEPTRLDERQSVVLAGQLTGGTPSAPGYLAWLGNMGFTQAQFTASGFGVDVTDSGVDNGTQTPNHFALHTGGQATAPSRVVYNRLEGTANSGSTLQGCDGHGNINAHLIGGYSDRTGATFADAAGYQYGLGVAPFVKIGSSVAFDPTSFTSPNYENLQSRAYRDGMRISSNSWGGTGNTYTADSQRYDALVRDAQPAASAVPVAGNQEMIIVFAAGNSGSGANTVGSPGTAKNVITVGASEGPRAFGGADYCGVADAQADSAHDVATFSGRGPCSDGRKKPDLMAPGTHITGGVAQQDGQRTEPPGTATGKALGCFDGSGVCGGVGSNFFPGTQQWFTASSGTSHSTPAVSGAAALVYQHFLNNGRPPPSPAMTKAYLMNAARYMTGTGANDNLYSNNQGMGLVDLGAGFDGVARKLDDQSPANLFTASGQTRTFTGTVARSDKPFRVTLAWTDAPGSTTGSAWKNNLDLTVTLGINVYKGNVFTGANSVTGGTADAANNVESVFLPAGSTGTFTVTVTAANINSDGVPGNASALDQDFALVIYNACDAAPPPPTGVTAQVNGSNRVDVSWTPNEATSYLVLRSLTAGGPYTALGTVPAPPYADTTVSGGTTYHYVVRGVLCAESANSTEATVTATGLCTIPPLFGGITSAASAGQSTCTDTLTWAAATPVCGGTVKYNVYRSTTPGFTPSAGNRIAAGVTGTSFSDNLNLTSGTGYTYVVRAVETSNAVQEDTNAVKATSIPYGAVTHAVTYFDDLDANRPANAAAYWTVNNIAGTAGTLNLTTGCHYQSATKSYRFGAASTACGGTYPVSTQARLVLGGDGTTAGINGFTLPAAVPLGQATFNLWYNFESQYDGAYLVYSTTSAAGPWTAVGDTASATAPYISAGGYDNTLKSNAALRIWTSTNLGANGALKAVTVNLAPLAGQKVWLGFQTYTDVSQNAEGMYLDDVRVTVDAAATCTTNVPPPGPAVSYEVRNLAASVQAGVPTTLDLRALDALGQVATGYAGSAQLTSTDPLATLSTATFAAGVATGISVTLASVGVQTLTATDTTAPSITGSGSVTVTPGPGTVLYFTVQPNTATAGAPLATVKVGMKDAFGNVVTTGTPTITLALGANPGGSTLGGTTAVDAVAGVASFNTLTLDKVGTGYTLVASSTGLTDATSDPFQVKAAAPARLSFAQGPTDVTAGAALTPAVTVAIRDAFDNLTDSTAAITVELGVNPSLATLTGTLVVNSVNGTAALPDLWLDKVGTGYTLKASTPGLPAVDSEPFAVSPAQAHAARFTGQPTDIPAGTPFAPPVQVTLYDRFDNVATAATQPVFVTVGVNPAGGSVLGTASALPVAGVASFPDLSINRPGAPYTLVGGGTGLLTASSVAFQVLPGAPAGLLFQRSPSSGVAGTALAPVQVAITDAQGNLLAGSALDVSLALGSNPAGGTLAGTLTQTAVNGIATFPDLVLDKVGAGYALVASAAGLADVTGAPFNVVAGAAAKLAFAVQPGTVAAGSALTPAVKVEVQDAQGNPVSTGNQEVTLTLGTNPGSATLKGALLMPTFNGQARFADLTLDRVGTGYTLVASSAGLNAATSNPFDVLPGAAAKLAFRTQPQRAPAGHTLGPVDVEVRDAQDNLLTDSTANVTLSLDGHPGATLAGTTTLAASQAVASFLDLAVAKAGTGYALTARSTGLAPATSAPFAITAGPAAGLAFVEQPASGTAGLALTPAVKVGVVDALGNAVAASTADITLALEANEAGATLDGTLTVAAADGVAEFTTLSLDRVGQGYTLKATAADLTEATSAAFDVAHGAAAALAFQVQPTTTPAGVSLAPAVKVEVQDVQGNPVPDAAGNVTLALAQNPGTATLAGTLTLPLLDGVARFADLRLDVAATGYTLLASSENLANATSTAFDVLPGPVALLAFRAQPQATPAGQPLPAVEVVFQDGHGNLLDNATGGVTLTLEGGTGALRGSTAATAVAGVAQFTDLAVDVAFAGYTLVAHAPDLPAAASAPFAVTAGAGSALAFRTPPASGVAGTALAPVVVAAVDALGNVDPTATGEVTLALGANPGNATLAGTATLPLVDGLATFADLALNRVGTGYALVAHREGLADVTSALFDIRAGAAASLAFSPPPADAVAGEAMAAVGVEVRDGFGNRAASTALVSLRLVTTGDATLGGTKAVNAVDGRAGFADLVITRAGADYALVASVDGLAPVTSPAFSVAAGAASRLVVELPPSTTAGQPVSLLVSAWDGFGNAATGYHGTVKFQSSDAQAHLPATTPAASGALPVLQVSFTTPGMATLTAVDSALPTLRGQAQTNVTPFGQPAVTITAPAAGGTVSGAVDITAEGHVATGTTLVRLSVLVDGVVVGSGTAASFTQTWDTASVGNGSHTVTATLQDAAGNVALSPPVTVTVDNGSGDDGGGGGCGCTATGTPPAALPLAGALLVLAWRWRRRRA